MPASLERLVLAALAKSPDKRPESTEAFAADLEACRDAPPWDDARATTWWRKRRAASPSSTAETKEHTLAIARDAGR